MNEVCNSEVQTNAALTTGNTKILSPIPILEDSRIVELQKALLRWIKKETGFRIKDSIHVTRATQFFGYRVSMTSHVVQREFEEKIARTDQEKNCIGDELKKNSLWTTRDDLLKLTKLKEEEDFDFSIKINETASIISCAKCDSKGIVLCRTCGGRKQVTCSRCGGKGSYQDYVEVTCPKCKGTGLYYT